jgi:nitrogen fixation protein FixH
MTRTFTGWHMAAITVSFFAVIIAVNITLAFYASSSWTGLVVENGYVASQSFNKDAEIARQQQAVGWQIKLNISRTAASVEIFDRAHQPLQDLAVQMKLQRPTDDADDKSLKLIEKAPGLYSIDIGLGTGVWNADVTAEGQDHKPVRFVQRIFIN